MSEKHWLHFAGRIILSLALLFCIYLVSTRAVALWYFRQSNLQGIRKAIEWDPGNPQYYVALAHMLERSMDEADIGQVLRLYEKATRLSPHQAGYWADLGGAYEFVGQLGDAQRAYERARELFPNSPRINWKLGNFYIRQNEPVKALGCFQKVLIGDPELRLAAFDLAWRAGLDTGLILEEMIPPDMGIFFQYMNYLARRDRIDEAGQVWAQLLELELLFEPRNTFPYLNALIRHKRVEELSEAWAEVAERNPLQVRQPSFQNNFITNGDFESEVMNGGLDWRVRPVEGVVVSVDSLNFFDGAHSLQIRFDGRHNINYNHIQQYVPVKPNTRYRFMGYIRTREITTDSGPHFQVYDAYDTNRLSVSTEAVLGTSSWASQQLEFQTGADTRLLVVRVVRPPSRKFDNQISGTAWIDRVSITSVE